MKKLISLVIILALSIAMIPVITGVVDNNLESTEVVTFEVLTLTTVTPGTYAKITALAKYEDTNFSNEITNIVSIKIDGVTWTDIATFGKLSGSYALQDTLGNMVFAISSSNDLTTDNVLDLGDVVTLTFSVENTATYTYLLALVPLLFVVVVVIGAIMYKKFND